MANDRKNLLAILRGQNVFVEGIGFIGKVGDITPPKVEFEMAEDGNMSRTIDSGLLKPLESEILLYDLNTTLFASVGKRLGDTASYVIKASMADGSTENQVYFELAAQVKTQEWENLKEDGKESGVKLSLSVIRYKLEINGKEQYDIDTDAMICKINGTDHYETLRKHIM